MQGFTGFGPDGGYVKGLGDVDKGFLYRQWILPRNMIKSGDDGILAQHPLSVAANVKIARRDSIPVLALRWVQQLASNRNSAYLERFSPSSWSGTKEPTNYT